MHREDQRVPGTWNIRAGAAVPEPGDRKPERRGALRGERDTLLQGQLGKTTGLRVAQNPRRV